MTLAAPALAHHISLSTGTAVVEPARVTVSLETPAEDLLHYYAEARRSDQTWSGAWLREAAARHAAFLLDNLVIRDEAGQRLRGRVIASAIPAPPAAQFDFQQLRKLRATFDLEYDLTAPPRLLTFQQTFNRGAAELPSQLALLVCRCGGLVEETIRLTSGGNAETLDFDWPASREGQPVMPSDGLLAFDDAATADVPSWLTGPERFKQIAAVIRRDGQGVTVDVCAPLTLLETWSPVARRDADFLDAGEQRAALEELRRLLAGAVRLRTAEGPIAGTLGAAVFMPPNARLLDDALADPQCGSAAQPQVGVWTARIGTRLRIPVVRDGPLELKWGLVNNAVLTARALVIDGPSTAEHEFSAYDPVLALPRGTDRRPE